MKIDEWSRRTDLDERVICVASEETVGEEGDDGVDRGHVQDSQTVQRWRSCETQEHIENAHICRCSYGLV